MLDDGFCISFLITNKGRVLGWMGDTGSLLRAQSEYMCPCVDRVLSLARDKVEEMLQERSTQSSTTGDWRQCARRLDCPVNRHSRLELD